MNSQCLGEGSDLGSDTLYKWIIGILNSILKVETIILPAIAITLENSSTTTVVLIIATWLTIAVPIGPTGRSANSLG